MRFRYLICHTEEHSFGSSITRRTTLPRAKKALAKLRTTIKTKIAIWDNQADKWIEEK